MPMGAPWNIMPIDFGADSSSHWLVDDAILATVSQPAMFRSLCMRADTFILFLVIQIRN